MAKEAKKGAKAGVARTKVSRTTKLERKLNGTSAKTPFSMKSAEFTVTGYAQLPVEIPGYLIERGDNFIIFRHKKTSASKQMVVTLFPNAEVIEQLGEVGKIGSVTVLQRKQFTSATGTVKVKGDTIVVTTADGETVNYVYSDKVQYEMKAVDAEGSQASSRGRSAGEKSVKGDKKKGKVTDIKEGKKGKKK